MRIAGRALQLSAMRRFTGVNDRQIVVTRARPIDVAIEFHRHADGW